MVGFTQVASLKILWREKEHSHGLMVDHIKVIGKMESSMELENIRTNSKMKDLAYGQMENALGGLMIKN